MVWIIPRKRSSHTRSKLFSKYKNIIVDEYFIMQKRKNSAPPSSRPPYRIITRGEYPYYEIAYGHDKNELKEKEWAYVANQDFVKLFPSNVDAKGIKQWFVAHFTQVALESGSPELKSNLSDDDHDDNDSNPSLSLPTTPKQSVSGGPLSKPSISLARKGAATTPAYTIPTMYTTQRMAAAKVTDLPSPVSGFSAWLPLCVVLNLTLILVRDASGTGYLASVVALNFFLAAVVLGNDPWFVLFIGKAKDIQQLESLSSPAANQTTVHLSAATLNDTEPKKTLKPARKKLDSEAPKRKPETDTSTSESEEEEDHTGDTGGTETHQPEPLEPKALELRVAGGSTHCDYEESFDCVNSWCATDAANFRVRIPPNYKKTKAKGPSDASLFHCAGFDIFYSPAKLCNIGAKITLPPFNFDDSAEKVPKLSPAEKKELAYCNGVPAVFIINFQIPAYTPAFFGAGEGKGYSVVMYFVLKAESRPLVKAQSTSAVRLLKRFCEGYKTEDLHCRLKAIPQVVNIDELDLARMIMSALRTYNAKPFLTGPKFHTFHEGEGYLEVDVDIHRFCYPARLLSSQFLPFLPQMVIDVGIVIEGIGDEEQPEQVLGCCRLFKIDHRCAHLTEPTDPPS